MYDERTVPHMTSTEWLNRVVVALGGLLIFVGIMLTGVFILMFLGVMEIAIFESAKLRDLFLWAFLVIGVLDLVSAVILRRR